MWNPYILIQESAFENVCEMAIVSRPQYANLSLPVTNSPVTLWDIREMEAFTTALYVTREKEL